MFGPLQPWMGAWRGQKSPKSCCLMYLDVIWRMKQFPGGFLTLELVRHSGLVLNSIMSHVWPPPALDGCLERAKMASHHDPICVTSVWVRLIPKVSITVVVTAKRMTKEAKKWGKMAILWLSERHNNSLMALKLFSHQYLLAPMIWCDFYHFWIPGSIIC